MLNNHLLTARCHVRRQPRYAAISALGLAIGLGMYPLIEACVTHERSYDEYHAQADRTYELIYAWKQGEDAPQPPRTEFATWGSGAIEPTVRGGTADLPSNIHFAFAVALPLDHVGVHEWLEQFAHRSSLSTWCIVAASGVVLAVALLTVSYQTLRAARLDPVDALRTE